MIFFLIPVYNEEQNLKRLYTETKKYMENAGHRNFRFIFVDDGSSDGSLDILKNFPDSTEFVTVLSHFPNLGVRRTFLEGFEEFLRIGQPGDILITKEADNTSDNSILGKMLQILSSGDADIVLASCYAKGGGIECTNFIRKLLSFSANLLIKLRFNMWGFHTFSSFYRGFTFSCLDKAFSRGTPMMTYEGFTCVVEMLIKLKKMKFRIKEIPMVLRSSERVGESKMPICKTILGYVRLCIFGVHAL